MLGCRAILKDQQEGGWFGKAWLAHGGPAYLAKEFGDNLFMDGKLWQGLSQRSDMTKLLLRMTTVCVARVREGRAEGKDIREKKSS